MENILVNLITDRLYESKKLLKEQFNQTHSINTARFFVVDKLLPNEIAHNIYQKFPGIKQMRLLKSHGELKLRCTYVKYAESLLQDLHRAFQNPKVLSLIEDITDIKNQCPDLSRLAGGISALLKGHYINPHLDNSHDADKKLYRTVNLLYYVSPDWKIENGGNYELWDLAVENNIVVPSLFNRLVVMETNQTSWHSVSMVKCNEARCCLFNYYFSKQSPTGKNYFHSSSAIFNDCFMPRPEQKFCRNLYRFRKTILGK